MSLTYGLKTPWDLLRKLEREHTRLMREVSSDNFFNFTVTAYHLIDWVKNDPTTPQAAIDGLSMLYSSTYLATCRDIANASKHFALNKGYKNQIVEKVSVISGYGKGRFGAGEYGKGEESIVVVLTDGQRCDALQMAQEVMSVWVDFFREHQLGSASSGS